MTVNDTSLPSTNIKRNRERTKLLSLALLALPNTTRAFRVQNPIFAAPGSLPRLEKSRLYSDSSEWRSGSQDSNEWLSTEDENRYAEGEDWEKTLSKKESGEFWSTFESSEEKEIDNETAETINGEDESEAWLDTLASLQAEEIEFNLKEADRADKARQMEEWGFDKEIISSTLGVATDDTLEEEQVAGMDMYREDMYWQDEVDLRTVESHTRVEKDPDTGDPIRSQMVYVDEHSCIGCYNCANTAQSTFFIDDEHGRARVFDQWGDDDETVQIAIETCPVDCIHYVPYEELVKLEVERRDQNINFKARLVNEDQAANRVGGPNAFTGPQKISGNMRPRCNNCPSRGCKDCPMYGVGLNPEFQRREQERKAKQERKKIQQERSSQNKSADL